MLIFKKFPTQFQVAKAAIEALYDCDVERYVQEKTVDPISKQTKFTWVLSGETFKGRLVHVANYTAKEVEAVDTLSKISKLMCPPEVDIPTGSRFKVTHTLMNGLVETLSFQCSGIPLKYPTNQVIPVRATQQLV